VCTVKILAQRAGSVLQRDDGLIARNAQISQWYFAVPYALR
jgi:hypothetical protein